MPGAHPDKGFHVPPAAFELLLEGPGLVLGKAPEWRASPDLPVITFRRLSPERGDRVCNGLPKRSPLDPDDFRIRKQAVQERFYISKCFGAAKVKKKHSDPHTLCR